ncbi:MAG: von Willebrand factor type A domain-containing protein [Myxococcales bacterium]|nr:von Willebrand factor type A domain-containing protein [Myxococcales bacterium]MCB9531225.1 von Willebrand factor type A domain-containing protein [Myxococcales bacterium]
MPSEPAVARTIVAPSHIPRVGGGGTSTGTMSTGTGGMSSRGMGAAQAGGRARSLDPPDRFVHVIAADGSGIAVPDGQAITQTSAGATAPANPWTDARQDALATFAVDVDTASYTIARATLDSGQLPAPGTVRVEEFLNSLDYGYAPPDDHSVFAIDLESAPAEFVVDPGLATEQPQILRVGLQGFEIDPGDRAPANLVFLVDTSGSMQGPDRLGLVRYALGVVLASLGPDDTLSIVTYAGRATTLLSPTRLEDRGAVLAAIDALEAGGSTNGADGVRTAYELARAAYVTGGINRVIWCTDGDLNVGLTGDSLLRLIEENGRAGIALTTLGFGRGNLNDRDLERFADHADGNYHFIDSRNEALHVLSDELVGTLEVIGRDVKIQVEFDPAVVSRYRLIGYENRAVADVDFRNDAVDAGEVGSGHSVTALLEYTLRARPAADAVIATTRVRYELPDSNGEVREISREIRGGELRSSFDSASPSYRLAVSTAAFAQVLRSPTSRGRSQLPAVEQAIRAAAAGGSLQREELAAMVSQASALLGPAVAR